MSLTLVVVFVLAYAAIALEHPIGVNKSAAALTCAGVLWTIYSLFLGNSTQLVAELGDSLSSTAQIVFFLMGAMTIVEVVDSHHGFTVITSRIRTSSLPVLMFLIAIVTFFLSAVLDNLTTTIVMISLIRKLLSKREDRLIFAGIIVIAANAGGAWTPIGDVTTTMLWIGGQITGGAIMKGVFLPSLASLVIPMLAMGFLLRGRIVEGPKQADGAKGVTTSQFERNLMFCLGIGILVCVPAFKAITHLPPFMGILFGLGLLWIAGDLLHRNTTPEKKQALTLVHALTKIDMSSIVFFIGILLSVAVLEHAHILGALSEWLDHTVGRQDIIVMIIGVISSVIDNVPLVAASMGMYNIHQFPPNSFIWEFMAYCAGTGGSLLIIGSAAGVAAMGLEKINFIWYFKKVSWLALIGYIAGAAVYLVQYQVLH